MQYMTEKEFILSAMGDCILPFLIFSIHFRYKIKCKKSEKETERYKKETDDAKV
jgi:hypothetical protein